MAYHPLFQEFMAIIPTWRVAFAMKSFGGESEKPTWLYASHALAQDLLKFRMTMPPILDDRQMVKKHIVQQGRLRVSGGTDLKASQSYPTGFGVAVELLMRRHGPEIADASRAAVAARAALPFPDLPDPWAHLPCTWLRGAAVEPVLGYLRDEVARPRA